MPEAQEVAEAVAEVEAKAPVRIGQGAQATTAGLVPKLVLAQEVALA